MSSDINIHDFALDCWKIKSDKTFHIYIKKSALVNIYGGWIPLRNDYNNANIVCNQQKDPIRALAEILINSIGSKIQQAHQLKMISVSDSKIYIPESMREAVELYFGNDNKEKITDIKMVLEPSIEEKEKRVNIYFYDNGTGQKPEDFKDTFMLYKETDKSKIPYLMGAYGMGSTGIYRFCGIDKCAVIITKRDPRLIIDKGYANKWSITVIRQHIERDKYNKSGYWEFLINKETNEPFTFTSDPLDILPITQKGETILNGEMKFGTATKCFNYNLKEFSYRTFQRKMSVFMWDIPFPFQVHEMRQKGGQAHLQKFINGKFTSRNHILKTIKIEVPFLYTFLDKKIPIKIAGNVYIFKRNIQSNDPIWREKKFSRMGVLTIEGLSHGILTKKHFIDLKNLKSLKKYLWITFDLQPLFLEYGNLRHDFFKADRETIMTENKHVTMFLKRIKRTIENNGELKDTNNKYEQMAMEDYLKKPLAYDLDTVTKEYPNLFKQLNGLDFLSKDDGEKRGKSNKKNTQKISIKINEKKFKRKFQKGYPYRFKSTLEEKTTRKVKCGEKKYSINFYTEIDPQHIKINATDKYGQSYDIGKSMGINEFGIVIFLTGKEKEGDQIIVKIENEKPLIERDKKPRGDHVDKNIEPSKHTPPLYNISTYDQKGEIKINGKSITNVFEETDNENLQKTLTAILEFIGSKKKTVQKSIKNFLYFPKIQEVFHGDKYYIDGEFDETAVGDLDDSEKIIYVNMDNIDYKKKLKSLDIKYRESFRKYYHLYILVHTLVFLNNRKKTIGDTFYEDIQKYYKTIQLPLLMMWEPSFSKIA